MNVIRGKHVGMLPRGVKVLQDSATHHTAERTRQEIKTKGWKTLEHSLTAFLPVQKAEETFFSKMILSDEERKVTQ